jgi:hypothetical protein
MKIDNTTKFKNQNMKVTLKSLAVIMGVFSSSFVIAQETEKVDSLGLHEQRINLLEDAITQSKKLKISGYIQTEWQSSQIDVNGKASSDLKVGAGLNATETAGGTVNRFGVRRGRLKATFTDNGYTGVFYIDATEKGVVVKEAYVAALDPWVNFLTLKGGIFNRPFGYEIEYSSSSRESPERSRIIQTLFPSERDLGGMITLQAPKTSPWTVLKLDAGLIAGNAIGTDTKSQKDFIAHLTYNNSTPIMKYGIGASLYSGKVFQPTTKVYEMSNNVFTSVGDSASNKNKFATRQYFGFDGQFSLASTAGLTTLRAEYIFGKQPGTSGSSSSYNNSSIPTNDYKGTNDIYIRNFSGGYVQLSQDIADTKHTLTIKYDWYDPNTKVSGNNIGAATTAAGTKATSKTDIAYSTLGLGYLYRMSSNLKFMVYYDMPVNEKSSALNKAGSDYTARLKANLLTVRMQYKF